MKHTYGHEGRSVRRPGQSLTQLVTAAVAAVTVLGQGGAPPPAPAPAPAGGAAGQAGAPSAGRGGGRNPNEGADFSPKDPIPPRSAAQQLRTFVLPTGYRLELVAAEPDVISP